LIYAIEETFGVAQVKNSIEYVRFSASVRTGNAVQTASELNKPLVVVFVVEELKPLQLHNAKVNSANFSLPHKLSQ
jgi:hypothetical protein